MYKKTEQIEKYHFKVQYCSGVKTFWSVQSNQTIIYVRKKLNSRNKTISISAFNFSTLYPNVSHHILKSMTRELISLVFIGGDKEFIGNGVISTNNRQKYRLPLIKHLHKRRLIILDNCYFTLVSVCFHNLQF